MTERRYVAVFEPISKERGQELADEIGAAKYVEVSAMTGKVRSWTLSSVSVLRNLS